MTPERLKEIRDKISKIKDSNSKLEGANDQILAGWQKLSINSSEEAEEFNEKCTTGIKNHLERKQVLVNKLESLTDWSKI